MRIGNVLIFISGGILAVTSLVKFLHPGKAVDYMRFLGYENEKLFLIAGLELVTAVLFLNRATRWIGLQLVSGYLGGAIAAHLAFHPLTGNAWIIVFNANHKYLGTLPALIVLACAWIGFFLRHPESRWSLVRTRAVESRHERVHGAADGQVAHTSGGASLLPR